MNQADSNVSPAPHRLVVLGSSHHSAPLEVREGFALSADAVKTLYQRILRDSDMRECLILNTCNRVEIYAVPEQHGNREQLKRILCDQRNIPGETFDRHTFWKTDLEAITHSFAVASGLDSQMVGETEILGQVKNAYAEAALYSATGSVLHRVFQKSFQAAKWVRTHTGVGKGQISIGNIAAELARRVCGELSESSILLIGAGEVGEKTAQALHGRGARQFIIAGRNLLNARKLAQKLGGAVTDLQALDSLLPYSDILLFSTAAEEPLLRAEQVRRVMRQRPARPLFIIDLAMPRDVEADAGKVNNTYLYNLDDLARLANENMSVRLREVEQARENLARRAEHLWHTMGFTAAPPPSPVKSELPVPQPPGSLNAHHLRGEKHWQSNRDQPQMPC